MMEIKKPKITFEENESKNFAKFVVEPLERGFGITLGNSLRRVLLSSLPGAAAVGIKIEGVDHEFSTIKGVKEEVTEIILNIKTVRFKVTQAQERAGKIKLHLYDIDLPSDVEVLNPDQVICTLDEGGVLDMAIFVDTGRGYVSAEHNKDAQGLIGYIPVDSIFTPVTKVNYAVESTRVEQRAHRLRQTHRRGHHGRHRFGKGDHLPRRQDHQRSHETVRRPRRQYGRAEHSRVAGRRQDPESARDVH